MDFFFRDNFLFFFQFFLQSMIKGIFNLNSFEQSLLFFSFSFWISGVILFFYQILLYFLSNFIFQHHFFIFFLKNRSTLL